MLQLGGRCEDREPRGTHLSKTGEERGASWKKGHLSQVVPNQQVSGGRRGAEGMVTQQWGSGRKGVAVYMRNGEEGGVGDL